MALRGRVHLLLQHPLVDRAHGPLRPAVDAPAEALGLAERVLGDRAAVRAADRLGAVGELVVAVGLARLLGPVGVADRHPADRDRVVDAGDRGDAGDPPAGADDHLAADRLADDPVRAADVVGALGGDRRRLDPEAGLEHRLGGLGADARCRSRGGWRARGRSGRSRARSRAPPDRAPAAPARAAPARSDRPRARLFSAPMEGQSMASANARGAGRRSRPTTAFAPTSRRASEPPPSAGSSTSSPG